MKVEFITPDSIEYPKRELKEDEWIDRNFTIACMSGTRKSDLMNRMGRNGKRHEKDEAADKLKSLGLAEIDYNGSRILVKGETVRGAGGWLNYLELMASEAMAKKEKADGLEKLEIELKESTIRVNNLTLENAEQVKRIADLNEENVKLQIKVSKWGLFRQYWWLTSTIYALILYVVTLTVSMLILPEHLSKVLRKILEMISWLQ